VVKNFRSTAQITIRDEIFKPWRVPVNLSEQGEPTRLDRPGCLALNRF
jgi:hypothetical protein